MQGRSYVCRALVLAATLVGLAMSAVSTAEARDTTFSPYTKGPSPDWLVPAMNASRAESQQLVKHWDKTDTAFWDAFGVPVYIGTPRQLRAMGQGGLAKSMQDDCEHGVHRDGKIVILTAGSWSCINDGEFYVMTDKQNQVSLTHEVLEFLVNPDFPEHKRRVNGHIAEVCDWVRHYSRYDKKNGAYIPDFVYPSFFKRRGRPFDYFHKRNDPVPTEGP